MLELDFSCHDFKIFNPLNERLVSRESFPALRKYTVGIFDADKFPKQIGPDSVLSTPTLHSICFKFLKLTMAVAECMTHFFRCKDDIEVYKPDFHIKHIRFEYEHREREALSQLMSVVLDRNPTLESFELVTVSAYTFLNVNNYLEHFEDVQVGPALRKLILRDAMKYTDKSNFLSQNTSRLEVLHVNKTILNQKSFRLSENLRVLKLNPVNFPSEIFEISFDQFIFVLEVLQDNLTIEEFEIGIRHGNLKRTIFNAGLYEKERREAS